MPTTTELRNTGTALMLERGERAVHFEDRIPRVHRGAWHVITSAAERLGITFSSSTRRIFSRTWNVVISFTVAEAA